MWGANFYSIGEDPQSKSEPNFELGLTNTQVVSLYVYLENICNHFTNKLLVQEILANYLETSAADIFLRKELVTFFLVELRLETSCKYVFRWPLASTRQFCLASNALYDSALWLKNLMHVMAALIWSWNEDIAKYWFTWL